MGDIAYAACSLAGLKILNISNPHTLAELGSLYDGGNAVALDFYEGYVVIADRDDGLEIIDTTDPANPIEIAGYRDGGSAAGIHIVGDLIFVADREDGLEILQIEISTANPASSDLTGIILMIGVVGLIVVIALVAKMKRG